MVICLGEVSKCFSLRIFWLFLQGFLAFPLANQKSDARLILISNFSFLPPSLILKLCGIFFLSLEVTKITKMHCLIFFIKHMISPFNLNTHIFLQHMDISSIFSLILYFPYALCSLILLGKY